MKNVGIMCLPVFVLMSGHIVAEDVVSGFMHDDLYRSYTLHIPAEFTDADTLPLVINLHGGNGSASQQATFSQMNTKADSEMFFCLYPNGTTLPAGYTGWNAGEWAETDVDDVDFISALIDTVVDNYNVDTLRIHATGFSLGAMMCHSLACELSHRIASVAPVEGGLTTDDWNACQPVRMIPVMHFHHRNDDIVPYYGDPVKKWAPPIDSVMEHWARVNGCNMGPDTTYNDSGALKQVWTRSDEGCEVVFWTLEQGDGHAWPGSPAGSGELSANDEMWEFFLAHPLGVKEEPGVCETIRQTAGSLEPIKPCLVSTTTFIRFTLKDRERVSVEIFDAVGREISTVVDDIFAVGDHCVLLNAAEMENGVYFCLIRTPTFSQTRVLEVIK